MTKQRTLNRPTGKLEETMKAKVITEIEVGSDEFDGEGQIEEYIKMTLQNGAIKVTVNSIDAREID